MAGVNNTDIKVLDIVSNLKGVEVCLHPVGLSLVNMLCPNCRFADDAILRENGVIKPLAVFENY